MHESFIGAERGRYAIFPFLLVTACLLAYGYEAMHGVPGGDSVCGYTLGGISAGLVIFLMCYGLRRRAYSASAGSTRSWLSLHIYLGIAVVVIAALHAGFQFGANVHTLAYVLLALVVLSGSWGVFAYLRYPELMRRERDGSSREQIQLRIAELDRDAASVACSAGTPVQDLVADAIARTRIGGGVWAQLSGRDASSILQTSSAQSGFVHVVGNAGQRTLISQLAARQALARDMQEQRALDHLLRLVADKAMLQDRLRRDVQMQGLLQIWLYLHLPLSFAMLVALGVHVYAVFFYW